LDFSSQIPSSSSTGMSSSVQEQMSSSLALSSSEIQVSSSRELSSSFISSSSIALSSSVDPDVLIDSRDQKAYKTVKIGSQTWMAENLNYGAFDQTPSRVQNPGEKFCSKNAEANCDVAGGMYHWHIAMALPATCLTSNCSNLIQAEHQGVCPTGWHVPSRSDFKALIQNLGGNQAGSKLKLANTPFVGWNTKNNDGNSSGFSAYPNGLMENNGTFIYYGESSHFWTSDQSVQAISNAYRYGLGFETSAFVESDNHEKNDAMSIRCIKNSAQ
jgi:uncharacterized protein (TIGR02145 family)